MKQHYRLTIWSLFFLITSSGSAFAQRKTITPIDSLITVGYATGSLKPYPDQWRKSRRHR